MGFSVPASMGVKLGYPDRTVITFVGDGSFQMTLQELGTIAQEKYPLKVVIMNNCFLGMVRQWQELFFDRRYASTPMSSPNYQKLCEAYGIASQRLVNRSDLQQAIQAMLDSEGPFVLEVAVENEENVFPMVPAGAGVDDIRLD
jgi:acetolactate synthase-1/2/3 large subunit